MFFCPIQLVFSLLLNAIAYPLFYFPCVACFYAMIVHKYLSRGRSRDGGMEMGFAILYPFPQKKL